MSNYEIRNDDDLKLWFRIKSIEKKIDKLGPMYSKGFDWVCLLYTSDAADE